MLPFDGRRSSFQLISEILSLLRLGEVGKTEVMYTVRLTHAQTQKYLSRLVQLHLVDQRNGEGRVPSYRITQKGLDVLVKIEQVQEMLQIQEVPDILGAPKLKLDEDRRILRRLKDVLRVHKDENQV